MNLVLEYIHYRWKANFNSRFSNETEVRIKNCISKSKVKLAFETELEEYRRIAKNETRLISIQDFGAGSKKMGRKRSIQNIYKNSRSTTHFQRILYHLGREFNCISILEMGTSLGFTSVYLSQATPNGRVITIEACENTAEEANRLFKDLELSNVNLINSTFEDYFTNNVVENFDLIFIDGHHDGKALVTYMSQLVHNCNNNCIFVLDDIRWSSNMLEAWKKIIVLPEFTFHIDLFRMGILVFNRLKD